MMANLNLILLLLLLLFLLLLLLLFNGFPLNSVSLDAMTTSTLKPVGHNTQHSYARTKQFTNKHTFQLQTFSVEVRLCYDRQTGKALDRSTRMKADVCTCAVARDLIRHIMANQRQLKLPEASAFV
jgi:hypothetical protein